MLFQLFTLKVKTTAVQKPAGLVNAVNFPGRQSGSYLTPGAFLSSDFQVEVLHNLWPVRFVPLLLLVVAVCHVLHARFIKATFHSNVSKTSQRVCLYDQVKVGRCRLLSLTAVQLDTQRLQTAPFQ